MILGNNINSLRLIGYSFVYWFNVLTLGMLYISYHNDDSYDTPVIIFINSLLCMDYHISCPSDPHIHIICAWWRYFTSGLLLSIFPTIIWVPRRENGSVSYLMFLCNWIEFSIISAVMPCFWFFDAACVRFIYGSLCFCSIYWSAHDILLYLYSIPQYIIQHHSQYIVKLLVA